MGRGRGRGVYLSGAEGHGADNSGHATHGVHDSAACEVDEIVGLSAVEEVVLGLVSEGGEPALAPAPVRYDGVDPDGDKG
jgi:hypothetical protein